MCTYTYNTIVSILVMLYNIYLHIFIINFYNFYILLYFITYLTRSFDLILINSSYISRIIRISKCIFIPLQLQVIATRLYYNYSDFVYSDCDYNFEYNRFFVRLDYFPDR